LSVYQPGVGRGVEFTELSAEDRKLSNRPDGRGGSLGDQRRCELLQPSEEADYTPGQLQLTHSLALSKLLLSKSGYTPGQLQLTDSLALSKLLLSKSGYTPHKLQLTDSMALSKPHKHQQPPKNVHVAECNQVLTTNYEM